VGKNFHESLSRGQTVQMGSNQSFGLVMGAACLVIAGIGYWFGSAYWPVWTGAAAVFGALAMLWPSVLYPLNRLWFWFGLALHKVVNPLVMGVLFFVVITPIGLLMRLSRKDPLGLETEPDAASYWAERGSELQPGPMTKQY